MKLLKNSISSNIFSLFSGKNLLFPLNKEEMLLEDFIIALYHVISKMLSPSMLLFLDCTYYNEQKF